MENDTPTLPQPLGMDFQSYLGDVDAYLEKQRNLRIERGLMKERFIREMVSQTGMRAAGAANIFDTLVAQRRSRGRSNENKVRTRTLDYFDRMVVGHKLRAAYALAYAKSEHNGSISVGAGTMCTCPPLATSECHHERECHLCKFKVNSSAPSGVEYLRDKR